MKKTLRRIGFIINDPTSDYCQMLVKGMQEACYNHNCTLYIFPVGEYGKLYSPFDYQKRAVAAFINSKNLDGLIFSSSVHGTHVSFEKLLKYIHSFSDIPVISLNLEIPGITSILADCKPGLDHMISHLITKHKCKRIALMNAGGNSKEAEDRANVYKTVLERYGIPYEESLVLYGFFNYSMAYKALEDYRNEHHYLDFDAIVCLNDYMAYAAIDYCKKNNISVPDEMKITGFDDIAKTSFSDPTVSTINQQIELQGEMALNNLVKLINKEEVPLIIEVPTKVRYRKSCGCIDLKENYFDYQNENFSIISKAEALRNFTGSEWLIRKDQLVEIENYYSNTQGRINIFDFTGNFQFVMTNFAVGAAAVIIYEKPVFSPKPFDKFKLPNRAYVLAAFDNYINFNYKRSAESKVFDPNESMLPEGFINFYNEIYYVVSLSNCEFQYGYLIYKPGNYDETMYALICTILSHQLASAYEYSLELEEKEKLSEKNQNLMKISRTDELTKLLNRRGLLELGQTSIDLSLKCGKEGMVIFGDMDNLKIINYTFGHDEGDRAIIETANILKKVFRSNDIVARIGGDEFAIVSPVLDSYSFKKIKEKIKNEFELWNENQDNQYKLSISLGFATFNTESFALSALLLEADTKQYKEKRIKKSKSDKN